MPVDKLDWMDMVKGTLSGQLSWRSGPSRSPLIQLFS